ncbi:MAG: alpha-E domain-containing protein [Pseudomonadales bacterium]|nr:alpha-E domain-containing protein [Pseudomonadales bacterium]
MLSSVAERVYWLGRYLERAENQARLLNVYSALLFDLPRGTNIGWSTLIDITGSNEEINKRSLNLDERSITRFLMTDSSNPMSIFSNLRMARENARTSREVIPSEAWEHINYLYLHAKDNIAGNVSRSRRNELLNQIIANCQLITGLLSGSMSHDTTYAFIHLGRKLERADMTTRIVDVGSISLFPGFGHSSKERALLEPYENVVWMSVLRSLSGYQAYRQRIHNRVSGEEVVRFLLQDEHFPRSVSFCLADLNFFLQKLPMNENVQRAVARVQRVCKVVDIKELLQRGLLDFIDELQISIADIHEELTATWFMPEVVESQSQSQAAS